MPAKSKKQERFMQAVANNPEFAKKVGVPTKVGKEFTKETKVKKYKPGGKVITPEKEKARIKEMAREDRYKKIRERDMKLFGPNEELTESDKREALNNALLKAGSKIAGAPKPKYFLEEAGEAAKNIKAIPPDMQKQKAKDKNKKLDRLIEQKTKIDRVKYGKKKGGKVKQMKKGGMVKRGDGCAIKGKTKGRMV
jgi:hypothetical protein